MPFLFLFHIHVVYIIVVANSHQVDIWLELFLLLCAVQYRTDGKVGNSDTKHLDGPHEA